MGKTIGVLDITFVPNIVEDCGFAIIETAKHANGSDEVRRVFGRDRDGQMWTWLEVSRTTDAGVFVLPMMAMARHGG